MIALLIAAALVVPAEIDPATTPGVDNPNVTQANIHQTICVANWTSTVRPPASYTNKLKAQQLKALGWPDQNPKDYEENHREPLSVGGSPTDPKNLSPEPYFGPWNARVRDKLEKSAQLAICAGRITLDQGRQIMRKDWIPSFNRYCGPTPAADCKVTSP